MSESRQITLVLPYYENAGMLREQQRVWSSYPDDLKAALHVIVVDDGSPTSPALPVVAPVGLASFRLYRILVDVRWNWLTCRNLGMAEATTEWVLMTDMDHVLPAETLRTLVQSRLNEHTVYRFSRVTAPEMEPYKVHPNTWLMTREMFDRVGGYDERFSGYYGSDGEFRGRVERTARRVKVLNDVMIRYPREVIADASTTTYGRKEAIDKTERRQIQRERDALLEWTPKRLTFPWEHQVTLLSAQEALC